MTRLSVNINKVATLRNARGGGIPNLVQVAKDCERFGAQGITVHPRPDERHIRYQDVRDLQPVVHTEFNIEGYPSEAWLRLVEEAMPAQATLVPDKPNAITSNAGWDTLAEAETLAPIVQRLKNKGIRVSIFVNANPSMVQGAAQLGAHRVELYTGPYAEQFQHNKAQAIAPYIAAAEKAKEIGIGLNAGHDLDLNNLTYFSQHITGLQEVSIGHALISDALYYGLENTIQLYLRCLKQ